jgi:tryptophan synthase alpha chain
MNRYAKTFTRLQKNNETGFVPFAVAGDPDCATSERILRAYIDGGADILEIGYPFSDPIADGPVNQRASQRSIAAGLTHAKFFALVKTIRACSDIPIGVLIYANSVLHLGYEKFCKQAREAGVDSLLVADIPPEESGELQSAMKRHDLGRVFIVTELTPPERMRTICSQVDSFVYVVSRLGATGVDSKFSDSVTPTIHALKSVTDKPLAVGFGISTPQHVAAVRKAGAHAAIVGSALVAEIEKNLRSRSNLNRLPGILAIKVAAYKAATKPKGGIARV